METDRHGNDRFRDRSFILAIRSMEDMSEYRNGMTPSLVMPPRPVLPGERVLLRAP
jgi:hypothetical protein